MGLKNLLSNLVGPDSSHPDEGRGRVPPSGDLGAGGALGKVLQVLAESTPNEEERPIGELHRLSVRVGQGDARAFALAPGAVEETRRVEKRWIEESVRGLADGVVHVLLRLGRSAGDDRADGQNLTRRLDGLRDAVRGESIEVLRKEVLDAVGSIADTLARRQERTDREMEAVSRQLRTLQGELNKVRREATLDGLTRLANRACLDEHIEAVLAVHRITGRAVCLLMVDVDHFKEINDRLGHPAGDAVLKALSDAMARSFPRRSDFVARYGGEEFAVVLDEDGEETGRRLADRLLQAVRAIRVPWDGEEIQITVSVGVASPQDADETADWVARADRRLYQAKQDGRDRVA